MRLERYFLSLSLVGLLFANPAKGLANDNFPEPMNPESNAVEKKTQKFLTDESTRQRNPAVPFEIAAVDYCYAGSVVDPATGELVDLFVLCAEDRFEQHLDIA